MMYTLQQKSAIAGVYYAFIKTELYGKSACFIPVARTIHIGNDLPH